MDGIKVRVDPPPAAGAAVTRTDVGQENAMKLPVLFDRSGTILAAVPLDDEDPRVPKPRPVQQRGQFTADITVRASTAR
jgi:hypothetical protein